MSTAVDVDVELRAAWLLRRAAWDALCEKDSPQNRDAWAKACEDFDELLDKRNGANAR
jgi:hypothetical protein